MTEKAPWCRTAAAALLGGMWGGALVALAEAALIAATTGVGQEYWLFPYAVVSYGACGALIGFGCLAVILLVERRVSGLGRAAFGTAAAAGFFLLGAAVLRYHVVQRVFHEDLVMLSFTGAIVHAGVVVLVGGCALLVLCAGRMLQRQPRGLWAGATGLVLCVALSSATAVLASTHAAAPVVRRSTTVAAQGRPNIILIIVDTLRADALGAYGAGPGASPALDRFAADGIRFAHGAAQSTWTRPSVATILTSLYPSEHGAVHKMDALSNQVTTLAEALQAGGYWTAGFVSNINVAPVFNFNQGFNEYTYLEPDFYFWATDSATRLAIYKGLRVVRERLFRNRIYFEHYYQDSEVVNEAVVNWLKGHPPTPFFLLIHYMEPHDPYFEHPYNGHGVARVIDPAPNPQRKQELRGLYGQDVAYLDENLGRLFARLKAFGIYDDSVILITADHGEEFQDHGGWWHGTTLYQEVLHVPMLLKRAHESRGGAVERQIARSLDVAPTLMAAAGLAAPASFGGHDLLAATGADPEALFAEEDFEGNVLASLQLGTWKIIAANADNPRGLAPVELYNLDQDPSERRNLAATEPQRVHEMLQRLAQFRTRIGPEIGLDTGPRTQHATDHRS